MKKSLAILLSAITILSLASCASKTCKVEGCEDEVYEDGYCKYHYTINHAKEELDNLGKEIFNKIDGNDKD